jgi:hypothetical protein
MSIGDRNGNGAYMRRSERLSTTETGKSSPSAQAARSAERKVSLGGFVGVEKKRRCLWNAVKVWRDMVYVVCADSVQWVM